MYKNGSCPIVLSEDIIAKLLEDAHACIPIEVDLPNQVVRRSNGEEYAFQVDEFRKHCLINGLDEISLTLEHEKDIAAFEERRTREWPWLDGTFPRCRLGFRRLHRFLVSRRHWLPRQDPSVGLSSLSSSRTWLLTSPPFHSAKKAPKLDW
jgi:hypothetical protein